MGDRTTTYLPCPNCGKESEQYDAPSCYMWSWNCEHCGWKDLRNYYETEPNTIELMTEEEAKKRGLIWISGLEAALSRKENGKKPNKITL